jgi:ABC-2 type transport system ATP-binding protein
MINNQAGAFIGNHRIRSIRENDQYGKNRLFAADIPAPAEPPEEINPADDTEPVRAQKRPAAEQVTTPEPVVSNPSSIIQVEHVDYLFTSKQGVHDLTFQVPRGVIFGLVGPSGCGKTTTVRLLNGMYHPTSGRLEVLGENPARFSSRAREKIGYMAQHLTLYPMLTVLENLNFTASLYGMGLFSRGKRLKEILKLVELWDARNRMASKLSGGMQRRLQLASALVHNPELIFADEPTAGTDPLLRSKFWEHFRSLRDEGHSLFITTQYIGEIEHCDVVGIMRAGRMLFVDTPEGLRRKAFGGDVIRLSVDPAQSLEAVHLLNNQGDVADARRSFGQPGMLYVSTNDAATAMPSVLGMLQERDIDVQQADRYIPPFDDVFIELMKQSGDENA